MLIGYFLLMMGPLVGGIFAFGIILGSLFRGLILLTDVQKRLSQITKNPQGEEHNEVIGLKDSIKNRSTQEGN